MPTENTLDYAFETTSQSIIKALGVGGGGGNAVTHMYKQGILNVSFALCNTDSQALRDSPVPIKLQLGEGLGAGNKPELARQIAEESIDEIKQLLNDGTKMIFITAGMGGGTGTGAAPVIAKIAKELDILTVGIVTIPFAFEGKRKILKALAGVEEMAKYVDALLVVNNERLREIYPDFTAPKAFAKADDTLTIAAKGIAEMITRTGDINLDFADVKSTLKDGGVASMTTGYGEGDKRVLKAFESALNSPLLNNNNVCNAKRLLFNIYYGDDELMTYELDEVDKFTEQFNVEEVDVIWGMGKDDKLGNQVKITLLASGFDFSNITNSGSGSSSNSGSGNEPEGEGGGKIDFGKKPAAEFDNNNVSNNDDNAKIKKWYIRSSEPAILTVEQMNDDELIAQMELVPSCKRNAKTAARNIVQAKKLQSQSSSPSLGQEDDGVIRFSS